jgi:hypothetical protein
MSECDDSVDKAALPSERAQPPQSIQRGNDREQAAQKGPLSGHIIDSERIKRQRAAARRRPQVLDHARFTAGIISLYEAVLNEPIPENMFRLIEEIGKQERKP